MGATKLPAEPQLMLWEEASLLGPGVLAGRHEVLSCEATHAHIPKPSAGFRSGSSLPERGTVITRSMRDLGGGGLPKSQPRGGLVRPQSHPLSPHHSQSTGRGLALAAPPAVTHLPHAPSFRRPPSSRRGEALWERGVEAGSGSLGAASSESAAGSGRFRACPCGC